MPPLLFGASVDPAGRGTEHSGPNLRPVEGDSGPRGFQRAASERRAMQVQAQGGVFVLLPVPPLCLPLRKPSSLTLSVLAMLSCGGQV